MRVLKQSLSPLKRVTGARYGALTWGENFLIILPTLSFFTNVYTTGSEK